MSKVFFFFILFLLVSYPKNVNAQCENNVTHIFGDETINDILVAVTSSGDVHSITELCIDEEPYVIGNDFMTSNSNGSYTFDFSPSIDSLSLSFSAINNGNVGFEIVKLFVNGNHYAIPGVENKNTCNDSLAVLTPFGNLTTEFSNLSGGGVKDLIITGPISSLTVLDSIVFGSPAGVTFSLFICNEIITAITENENPEVEIFPNPANDKLTISGLNENKVDFELYDLIGRKLKVGSINNSNGMEINVSHLIEGFYFLVISNNGKSKTHKVLINRSY